MIRKLEIIHDRNINIQADREIFVRAYNKEH